MPNLEYPTQLLEAAAAHDLQAVRLCLLRGHWVDEEDDVGRTALFLACHSPVSGGGNTEMAAELLEAGANPNHRMAFGNTPLMVAAGAGNMEMCEMLLSFGADPDLRNDAGLRALDMAYATYAVGTVNLLNERAATPMLGNGKQDTPEKAKVLKFVPPARELGVAGRGPL